MFITKNTKKILYFIIFTVFCIFHTSTHISNDCISQIHANHAGIFLMVSSSGLRSQTQTPAIQANCVPCTVIGIHSSGF